MACVALEHVQDGRILDNATSGTSCSGGFAQGMHQIFLNEIMLRPFLLHCVRRASRATARIFGIPIQSSAAGVALACLAKDLSSVLKAFPLLPHGRSKFSFCFHPVATVVWTNCSQNVGFHFPMSLRRCSPADARLKCMAIPQRSCTQMGRRRWPPLGGVQWNWSQVGSKCLPDLRAPPFPRAF